MEQDENPCAFVRKRVTQIHALTSVRLEESQCFEMVQRSILRTYWRLKKRRQRYWERTTDMVMERLPCADRNLEDSEVKITISLLPPLESIVLTKVILQGYTVRETAYLMGRSVGYIQKAKVRGLSALEEMLYGQD